MADELPSLHIDTDWKKQAQEEKKRLAEQEQAKPRTAATPAMPPAPPVGSPAGTGAGAAAGARTAARRGARGEREMPQASFASLVQSLLTQALFYMGELATPGIEPVLNLDMAKYQVDLLAMLEQKTANNLTDEEKKLLDAALYETRTRYVSVASQFL